MDRIVLLTNIMFQKYFCLRVLLCLKHLNSLNTLFEFYNLRKIIKMESFTLFRTHLAMSGIRFQQTSQSRRFNARNLSILIVPSFGIISYVKQFHETTTFEDRADVMFNLISTCFFTAIFLSIVCKTPELFRLIDDLDNIVNERTLNLNRQFYSA